MQRASIHPLDWGRGARKNLFNPSGSAESWLFSSHPIGLSRGWLRSRRFLGLHAAKWRQGNSTWRLAATEQSDKGGDNRRPLQRRPSQPISVAGALLSVLASSGTGTRALPAPGTRTPVHASPTAPQVRGNLLAESPLPACSRSTLSSCARHRPLITSNVDTPSWPSPGRLLPSGCDSSVPCIRHSRLPTLQLWALSCLHHDLDASSRLLAARRTHSI